MCDRPHAHSYRPIVISVARFDDYCGDMLPIRIFIFLIASLIAAPSMAQSPEDAAQITVLPGWRTERGTHMAALKVTLAPGWKTYWRSPGEAGIPPRFGWEGSENLASVAFHWPRPEVYVLNGMRSIGYYDELILPMEFTPNDTGKPIRLNAEIEIGVCHDICVPLKAYITADLPTGGRRDTAIINALRDMPTTGQAARVRSISCNVEPIRDGLRLTAQIKMAPLGGNEVTVFELADQSIWVSESEGHREGQSLVAASDLVPSSGQPFALDRSSVRITVLGQGRAVELMGCPAG